MKKNLLTALAFISVGSMFAQLPVNTSPQNKKAVIEEFTGIYCGYCPDGHQIANSIKTASPSQVVLVNIHAGGYASVLGTANGYTESLLYNGVFVGEPDLTSTGGTAINNMTGMSIGGYPAGDVNRLVIVSPAPQTAGGMAQNRGNWATIASGSVTNQSSYCNVALQGTVDVTTRVLTVDVQVYYTANSPVSTNSLTVMLLENKVKGPQHNYGSPLYNAANYDADGSYNHNHMLRKTLTTGNFGMTIPNTTSGTTFSTTLTYTIPATYGAAGKQNFSLLGNLELAAFVTETDRPTVTGANGPITMVNFPAALDIAPTNLQNQFKVCSGQNFVPKMRFSNLGSSTVTSATFTYAVNGGAASTYTWSGTVNPQTQTQILTLPAINFSPLTTNTLSIGVVSVNAGVDGIALNNVITNSNIPLSTLNAPAENMQMDFTQDKWGTECRWTVYNDATGAVLATDGPWSNLGANGTLLHTKTFTIAANTCYQLYVEDAAGDGVNSGYGAGGYILKSGGNAIVTSPGTYAATDYNWFKGASVVTGVNGFANNVRKINLFPNPTSGVTNLSIELTQNENVGITVINSIGQEVYSSKSNSLNAGVNNVGLNTENWAAGVYFVNVTTLGGSTSQKLNVTK
jgi:hypothetical protein